MNFTNIFFGLMSLTNLTLFLNRVVHDGQYETVMFLYFNHAIEDTNFVQELSDSPYGHYSIVTVCMDEFDHSIQLLESIPYRNLKKALQIIVLGATMPVNDILFTRDTTFLYPMWPHEIKQDFLDRVRGEFRGKGNFSMIFYQTPRTIQQADSTKSIEVFVVDTFNLSPDRSVFGIDLQSDIHVQLNRTDDLHSKLFEPTQKTLLYFSDDDGLKTVTNLMNTKSAMSGNANIYLWNYIARNMKNLTTWQAVPIEKYYDIPRLKKYEPSNGSIYAELFILPSEKYYESQDYEKV